MRLKERITFVEAGTTDDTAGGYDKVNDIVLYECWANVTQGSSSRQFQNLQLTNMVMVTVTMRKSPDFNPSTGQNIRWKNKYMTVQGEPDQSETQFISFIATYDPKWQEHLS
jgi:hypothetical protein